MLWVTQRCFIRFERFDDQRLCQWNSICGIWIKVQLISACSTNSCRRPWPDQSWQAPCTRAGTLSRESVSDKSDRITTAFARTSMWSNCRQPFCSLKPSVGSHNQRGSSKSASHPIAAVPASHGHLLRQGCLPLAPCLANDQTLRNTLCMRYNWQPDHLSSHCALAIAGKPFPWTTPCPVWSVTVFTLWCATTSFVISPPVCCRKSARMWRLNRLCNPSVESSFAFTFGHVFPLTRRTWKRLGWIHVWD